EGPELDGGYWYRNLRRPVGFHTAVTALAGEGFSAFTEISAHPVLVSALSDAVPDGIVSGSLRRDDGGLDRFYTALAEVYVAGVPVDWTPAFGPDARPVADLPTYAFQHESYWLDVPVVRADVVAAGLVSAEHPLLGAVVELAGDGGLVLTGRLSLKEQPWLADHAVQGTVLLSGTAFLEMLLHAGERAGCEVVEELTLETPLVLPAGDGVQLQLLVEAAGEGGRRGVSVFARVGEGVPWVRHAVGVVVPDGSEGSEGSGSSGGSEGSVGEVAGLEVWPPEGAERLVTDGLYEGLAEGGYGYGPAFRGLRAAWRRGGDLFAEVVLPGESASGEFLVHPALLDAALHVMGVEAGEAGGAGAGGVQLPFSWNDVRVHATGATTLRVHLTRTAPDTLSLVAADGTGLPVLSVSELVVRSADAGQLAALSGGRDTTDDALHRLAWSPQPSPSAPRGPEGRITLVGPDRFGLAEAGLSLDLHEDIESLLSATGTPTASAVPDTVVVSVTSEEATTAQEHAASTRPDAAAHRTAHRTLETLRAFLTDDRLDGTRLVLLTRRAVAVEDGAGSKDLDLAGATVWGLGRSAQSEHPGRVLLVDLDGEPGSADAVPAVIATGEPQVAIRAGVAYTPRLEPARSSAALPIPPATPAWSLDINSGSSLGDLRIVACPEVLEPLTEGRIRVSVRATGLNFRDVLLALDVVPSSDLPFGGEGAGVVTEVGPGVTDLAPGDRVMGFMEGSYGGPVAVVDRRLVAKVPEGWSFTRAASVPVVFLTAFYALRDVAGVVRG
ncbi:polyketide synthase dehydratase domain-containing protein, partial [Streptomyces sp. NPDC053750]|uniref:polyketide synthase dehydratase domain-containing protein n=1 Tax=Streptomyces sp. NPDC053750 TaxID=3365714 RepID=UPI0037CE48D3